MKIVSIGEQIRSQVIEALAKGEQPNFSNTTEEQQFDAFSEVWEGLSAKASWMEELKTGVETLSGGKITVTSASVLDFPWRVKGPAEYLQLNLPDGSKKYFIMGPYSTPIEFA